MEKKTVHVISHSHWDREWYMPFERFRLRLVQLIDAVIDLLESEESGFRHFHLDGHVLLMEDYLEIRPEREERLRRLVEAGKLQIGPWYVLQDAFLTSGEAQVRNLLYGIERARELGGVTMVGYFPDTFGNISQSAQLLQGFEIENAVFGRGINAIAENNTVVNDNRERFQSELWWASPDGSKVLSVFLANWYHNGMELPIDAGEAKKRMTVMIANVEKLATTPHLLLMNGCDHQPVQRDVAEALHLLNSLDPNMAYIHSNFPAYFAALGQNRRDWVTVTGELIGEFTDGWTTLVNTASSRMYLKQWNFRVQTELERWVEPFAAIAWTLGRPYPEAFVRHAWKLLLQNHPHDSICGCSVDEVHEEMVVRFKKTMQIADTLSAEALDAIASAVDTAALAPDRSAGERGGSAERSVPLVVFNPLAIGRSDVVTAYVDMDEEINAALFSLFDSYGNHVRCETTDEGWVHGFTLPDDRFRIPWRRRRYAVRFLADVPALGYAAYVWMNDGGAVRSESRMVETVVPEPVSCILEQDGARLENEHLLVLVHADGSIDLILKASGHTFRGLMLVEDIGDNGNEYTFVGAQKSRPITTRDRRAELMCQQSGVEARLGIVHRLNLPARREGKERSVETVEQQIEFFLTLSAGSPRLDVEVRMDNQVRDHRLRVLFPSGLQTEHVYADAPFDIVKRSIEPWSGWTNPSHCERMQSFFALDDCSAGLAIAAEGLPEYEVLRDGQNTMALTLLRCVGELGDWNYFPTESSQCQGPFTARFSIIPYLASYTSALGQVQQFAVPLRAVATTVHKGELPARKSWIALNSDAAVATSLKKADTFNGLQFRFFNSTENKQVVRVEGDMVRDSSVVSEVLLNEKELGRIEWAHDAAELLVMPKRIVTIGLHLLDG